ncbi:MAG: hypothetical protein CV089_08925, partial [Nitrospira sp. WS110]|nr:hypothetical protein [Nitrospira sp. WS110]
MDWLPYLEFAVPFLPWKAAGKFLLSHTVNLSVGLSALFISKTTKKGDTAMNKPALGDYLIAHPFALPLWVGVYGYLFIIFEP